MEMYRKKPVVVEAARFTGEVAQATPIIDWILTNGGTARYHEATPEREDPNEPGTFFEAVEEHIAIDTLEGTMRASIGDWIIRGVQGEFYPCRGDIFEQTYEPADPEEAAQARYREAIEAGLSDPEAREEGWPSR